RSGRLHAAAVPRPTCCCSSGACRPSGTSGSSRSSSATAAELSQRATHAMEPESYWAQFRPMSRGNISQKLGQQLQAEVAHFGKVIAPQRAVLADRQSMALQNQIKSIAEFRLDVTQVFGRRTLPDADVRHPIQQRVIENCIYGIFKLLIVKVPAWKDVMIIYAVLLDHLWTQSHAGVEVARTCSK